MTTQNAGWIKLASFDNKYFPAPVKISSNEYVVITECLEFLKYNATSRSWQQLFCCDSTKLNIRMGLSSPTVSYDHHNDEYYIFSRETLAVINSTNPELYKIYKYSESASNNVGQHKDVGITPCSVIINDKFHLIGGYYNNKYITFDCVMKIFKIEHTFNEWNRGNSGAGLVYISHKNEMMLMGGFDEKANNDEDWMDDIQCYSFDNNIWNTLPIKLPDTMCDFPYFLTNNEKYIVLILNDDIHYLNLDTMMMKKSDIICPSSLIKYAIMIGNAEMDDIIVDGFIRNVCKIMLPDDIIKMIMSWYITEYVHVFDPYSDSSAVHWEMNIVDIIPQYNK